MLKIIKNLKNEALSLIGIFSFLYPVLMLLRAAFISAEGVLLNLLIDFVILIFGAIASQTTYEIFKLRISIIIGAIAILTGSILKSSFEISFTVILDISISAFIFLFGYLYKSKSKDNFFGYGKYKPAIFVIAFTMFISYYIDRFHPLKPFVLLLTYMFIISFILERNRYKLEWAFDQNGVDRSVFSTKIRSYNRLLSGGIFIVILSLSNINLIKDFFLNILRVIAILILEFNLFLSYLFSLIMGPSNSQLPGNSNNAYPINAVSKPSIGLLIFEILVKFIALYLAYKAIVFLFNRLKGVVKKYIEILINFIKFKNKNKNENNDEYVDCMEILKIQSEVRQKKHKKRNPYKNYNKITDSIEKIRWMYGSLVKKLKGVQIDIKDTDTTFEIYNKVLIIDGIEEHFKDITEIYETVRYKDQIPELTSLSRVENEYRLLYDIIRKNN